MPTDRTTHPAAEAVAPTLDRDRDVFVTSFDVRISYVHGRRSRSFRGEFWHVFVGRELIEQFEDLEEAIDLARKVATRTGRPAWLSADDLTFEAVPRAKSL